MLVFDTFSCVLRDVRVVSSRKSRFATFVRLGAIERLYNEDPE
jgi:hypothetical protein